GNATLRRHPPPGTETRGGRRRTPLLAALAAKTHHTRTTTDTLRWAPPTPVPARRRGLSGSGEPRAEVAARAGRRGRPERDQRGEEGDGDRGQRVRPRALRQHGGAGHQRPDREDEAPPGGAER